ncbi:MAG TPA: NAD(P)/FAD-dependent oxidoreductase [Kofleriaceae bacterium]|nr:NAD(P)/FAD-dependent oxidoreductase [Kofleriaceae bacterium]
MNQELDIAVIGCGSAGAAAALLLARDGHRVTVFEKAPRLLPLGAGFMLQPTGMDVLQELGILGPIIAHGAHVDRLRCETRTGRRILDLAYAEVHPDLFGLGMHRAVLLHYLAEALAAASIPLCLDCDVTEIDLRDGAAWVREARFDLVVVANGARSGLRAAYAPEHKAVKYPWGALWCMRPDPGGLADGRLFQIVDGVRHMIGFLPTGRTVGEPESLITLFASIELSTYDAVRTAGLESWKRELIRVAPRAEPILAEVHDFDQLTLASYMDVTMRPWHRGPVVFIGDAAHATSPQLGQGVNLALVDARALASSVAGHDDLDAALRGYAAARRRHLAYYQWATRWLTPFFQSSWRPLGWMRDLGFGMTGWIRPLRRQMVRTMVGVKRGFVRRSMPLPQLSLPPPAPVTDPSASPR